MSDPEWKTLKSGERVYVQKGADGRYRRVQTPDGDQPIDVPGNLGVTTGDVPKVPARSSRVPPEQQGAAGGPAPAPVAERDVVAEARRKHEEDKANRPKVAAPRERASEGKTFSLGALDGMSLGWAADAMGTGAQAVGREKEVSEGLMLGSLLGGPLGGLVGAVRGALSGDTGPERRTGRGADTPLDQRSTRQRIADQYRDTRDQAYADNPKSALAGEVLGGGVATAPLAAVKPLQAAYKAAPFLTGALEGMGIGAFQGAGKARSGQAAEGASEGAESGMVAGLAGAALERTLAPAFRWGAKKLGLASDAAEGAASGISEEQLKRRQYEGAIDVPDMPEEAGISTTRRVKGLTRDEAISEVGQAAKEEGFGGSYANRIKQTRLAKARAAAEMEAITDELTPSPERLNPRLGFETPDGTKERLMDALEFEPGPMTPKEPIVTPASNPKRLAPNAESRPSKSPPPLPKKHEAIAEAEAGLADESLDYLRTGMRDESRAYWKKRLAEGGDMDPIELQRNTAEDGSKQWHLIDGRHRLEAAREAGIPNVRANIRERTVGPKGTATDVDLPEATIPVPKTKGFVEGGPTRKTAPKQILGIEDAVLVDAPTPKASVSLKPLERMLKAESDRLAKLPNTQATQESDSLAEELFTVSEAGATDFRTALELRRYFDGKAYDAAGQKAGQAAEQWRAMATAMRQAIDETLDQAPPEVAARMRKALKTYERASDAQRYAMDADAVGGARSAADTGRTVGGRLSQKASRIVGNAPARAEAGVADLGRYTLEQFPGALPAFSATLSDDEEQLERAKQSLPR